MIRSTIEIETPNELSDAKLAELARLIKEHLTNDFSGTIHDGKPVFVRAVCSCGHVMMTP